MKNVTPILEALAWLILFVPIGCDQDSHKRISADEQKPEMPASEQLEQIRSEKTAISEKDVRQAHNSESGKLTDELRQIFSASPAGSKLSEENLSQLSALVPHLIASGRFWDVIGAVPPVQLSHFRDVILSQLENLQYKNGSYVNPQFRNAYRVAHWLGDPEVATIAFKQLLKEKPFVYPRESPVNGWPTAEHTDYLVRGNQGVLATAVVEFGDEKTMQEYRKMLTAVSNDSMRVLIWALGRSTRLEDFELLIRLQEGTQSPEIADTIKRALNRIPMYMENSAKSPESALAGHRPAQSERLLQIAESCRKRLSDMNLAIETSFED